MHFLPSETTSAIDRAVTELGIEVRRDTVTRLREIHDLVAGGAFDDPRKIQRFAVEQGLVVGAQDMPLRTRTEGLWDHLHARGRLYSTSHGLVPKHTPSTVRSGFEVAAGS
jgi:hypothetical protein